jgi:homogentisate 1,2-dioxygenase
VYYSKQGTLPPKPFTEMLGPHGAPTHEELLTSSAFSGPVSLIYHLRPATVVSAISLVSDEPIEELAGGGLRNHQVEVEQCVQKGDLVTSRVPLFFNEDLVYSACRPTSSDGSFYRNAFHDELWLVCKGGGRLGSTFGSLDFDPLDFVYIPRGVTVALEEIDSEALIIIMEASSPIGPPSQYLGSRGQLSFHGMYQERDLRLPVLEDPHDTAGDHEVFVKAGDRLLRHIVPSHPFDVVGWDGALYPFALSMRQLTPMSGRVHTLPDIYNVFQADGVYMSAITPMRQPDHESSTSAQPDHASDCDEIFHRLGKPTEGGFESGMVTLHTRAAAHGAALPLKERPRRERSTGWGLLIDTVRPAKIARQAGNGEVPGYHGGQA